MPQVAGLGLTEGDTEGNGLKISQVGDRAEFALEMAILSDQPEKNTRIYRDRFIGAIPEAMRQRFMTDVGVEPVGEDAFIVTESDQIAFGGEVVAHHFNGGKWIAVWPVDSESNSVGIVIDTRTRTFDEMVRDCVKEVNKGPMVIRFET
jgi:hypothetical protein